MRPVFGANKAQRSVSAQKPNSRPLRKVDQLLQEADVFAGEKNVIPLSSMVVASSSPLLLSMEVPLVFHRHERLLNSNFSLSASCSSNASSDSIRSHASTGRMCRNSSIMNRRRQLGLRPRMIGPCIVKESLLDGLQPKKRCGWVTPKCRKLFELLVFSGALAELTWPASLSKRHIFREVFDDFNPVTVAKLSEKRIIAPGSTANLLLTSLNCAP